jgi:hypothetical protein
MAIVDNWIPVYQDKYQLFGCSQVMVVKIFWDWAIYWSVPCLLFTNHGFTDLKVLKELFVSEKSLGRKFGILNKAVQDLFLDWLPHEKAIFENRYIDPLDLDYLKDFQRGIDAMHGSENIVAKVAENMAVLEHVAASVFRLVSHQVNGTPLTIKVDPYKISLKTPYNESEHADGLLPDEAITTDVEKMWFYKKEALA